MAATLEQVSEFMIETFPQSGCKIESLGDKSATVSHAIGADDLRPGGTVAGPVLMKVADVALYVAILGEIGIVPLTVTTNLTINFLQKPLASAPIIGKCSLLKVGKTLVFGEVWLYSEGNEQPVAHAVGTYAIPQASIA